jgi:SPX domain protein involved in polyphosphate accumulation
MEKASKEYLIKEVKKLRLTLAPVLSEQYKNLLLEVENVLRGNPVTNKKRSVTQKKVSKKDAYLEYYNR